MKFNRYLNILITVLLVILVGISAIEIFSLVKDEKLEKKAEQINTVNSIPSDENSITLSEKTGFRISNQENHEVFLTYEDFKKDCTRSSYNLGETSVTYRLSKKLTAGGSDFYLLRFKMRSENESAKVSVRFGSEYTAYLTTQWREYYFPCAKGSIDSIKLTLESYFQKTYLSDLEIIKYDMQEVKVSDVTNGVFLTEGISQNIFSETSGLGVGKSMDVVCDGQYLYSAGDGHLTITRLNNDEKAIVSTLYGIGNIRHIELKDERILAAASRENGIYLINIEDKANPFIESHYDSLELANDVCFSGNYMFVASRYFGVEIVDISDIKKPVYISRIVNDKECFRCTIDGTYLFVSCWATCEVEIYNVSDLRKPELVSTIPVVGRCGETFVDNSIAYIVSGYHASQNTQSAGDVDFGTGNALNIFDVSQINNPVWKSTIKTEGCLFGNGYDDWSVQVNNGYAYFTNSFGGLYVYDVSDVSNPVAVTHTAVKIFPSSENFVDFYKSTRYVFPYDAKEFIYSPVMGVCLGNNSVFFACAYNDVYELKFDKARSVKTEKEDTRFTISEKDSDYYGEYSTFIREYDVSAIAKYNSGYIAATNSGLLLLDSNLDIIDIYLTKNAVKDVKTTQNDVIVTAEIAGVSLYKTENNKLVHLSTIQSQADNRSVSSIGVTGDGNFVVSQSSWTKFELINIQNHTMPYFVNEVMSVDGRIIHVSNVNNAGNMYYRNIVSGTVNGAVGIGGGNNMLWFNSSNGYLKVMNSYANKFGSEVNGSSVTKEGSKILSVYNNGFVVYDPLQAEEKSNDKAVRHYIPNVRLKGKCSILEDILVICNASNGQVYIVSIDDIANPYVLSYFKFKDSPNIALIEEDFVLIPLRHGGIVKIDL